jgi:hypothetical protein
MTRAFASLIAIAGWCLLYPVATLAGRNAGSQ